ncbi:MAG TPA: hypothetical protein VJN92_20225 [Candidatus Acidoferrum sp.]|nr:hypothetical protein [Candidatus Acidoferrum sp.]
MKIIDSKKAMMTFSGKRMEELRQELRKSFRDEHSWRLEALGRILETAQASPTLFRQFWIQPLQAAGLSFEVAVALVVDSYFQPN